MSIVPKLYFNSHGVILNSNIFVWIRKRFRHSHRTSNLYTQLDVFGFFFIWMIFLTSKNILEIVEFLYVLCKIKEFDNIFVWCPLSVRPYKNASSIYDILIEYIMLDSWIVSWKKYPDRTFFREFGMNLWKDIFSRMLRDPSESYVGYSVTSTKATTATHILKCNFTNGKETALKRSILCKCITVNYILWMSVIVEWPFIK